MKKKIVVLICFLLCLCYSCDLEQVIIPEPIIENNDDDDIAAEPRSDAKISVNFGDTHQTIDGFGCFMGDWTYRTYTHTKRDEILDRLFSKEGLHLNILRGCITHKYADDATETYNFQTDLPYDLQYNDPALTHNFWSEEQLKKLDILAQMWVTEQVQKKYDVNKFTFSVWSPPPYMKTNGKPTGFAGKCKKEYYEKFATYILDFVNAYEEKFGIKIHSISPTNEPDNTFSPWATCGWSAKDLGNLIVNHLRPKLNEGGKESLEIIVGEEATWHRGAKFIKSILDEHPEIANANIISAGHGYNIPLLPGAEGFDEYFVRYEEAEKKDLKVWLTELSSVDTYDSSWENAMLWAKIYQSFLREANVNAIVWWAGARPGQNNEMLILMDRDNAGLVPGITYELPLRYYAFGQFSKYLPEGSVRVGVEQFDGEEKKFPKELTVSAYHKENNYTLIIVNNDSKDFETQVDVEGVRNMRAYTSTRTMQWSREKINPSRSGKRSLTIPANSIVTIVGELK